MARQDLLEGLLAADLSSDQIAEIRAIVGFIADLTGPLRDNVLAEQQSLVRAASGESEPAEDNGYVEISGDLENRPLAS